jgi:hypothetical protein
MANVLHAWTAAQLFETPDAQRGDLVRGELRPTR